MRDVCSLVLSSTSNEYPRIMAASKDVCSHVSSGTSILRDIKMTFLLTSAKRYTMVVYFPNLFS